MENCVRARDRRKGKPTSASQSPLPSQGRGEGEGFIASLLPLWTTPHLNPLLFTKRRGGTSAQRSPQCYSLVANRAGWAEIRRRFCFTPNHSGRFNLSCYEDWNPRRSFFRRELIRSGVLLTCNLSQTISHHADRLAALPRHWRRCTPHICLHSRSICR